MLIPDFNSILHLSSDYVESMKSFNFWALLTAPFLKEMLSNTDHTHYFIEHYNCAQALNGSWTVRKMERMIWQKLTEP